MRTSAFTETPPPPCPLLSTRGLTSLAPPLSEDVLYGWPLSQSEEHGDSYQTIDQYNKQLATAYSEQIHMPQVHHTMHTCTYLIKKSLCIQRTKCFTHIRIRSIDCDSLSYNIYLPKMCSMHISLLNSPTTASHAKWQVSNTCSHTWKAWRSSGSWNNDPKLPIPW